MFPAVVGLPGGGFVVTWEGNGQGDSQGIFSRAFGVGDGTVVGTPADDTLTGSEEDVADTIHGMAGDDLLDGGLGDDVLWGGPGADTFRIDDLGGTDTIKDFFGDDGDVIAFGDILTGLQASTGDALDHYLQLSFVDGPTTIAVDADGGGDFDAPDAEIVVENVDLTTGGGSQAAILDALLAADQLQVTLDQGPI